MSQVLAGAHHAYQAALLGEPCRVVVDGDADGHRLAVARWQAEPDAADAVMLDLCRGATVDVGCGPGRLARELLARGMPAMGIDIVPEAVRQTRARGGLALERDVFALLPAEGRWGTALLADGNIGIGGDPVRLLRRMARIVSPEGRVVVELDCPGGDVRRHRVVLHVAGTRTRPFPWSVVPADRVADVCVPARLRVVEVVAAGDRWFAALERAGVHA
jgi:SAM-dependent methyltransferase